MAESLRRLTSCHRAGARISSWPDWMRTKTQLFAICTVLTEAVAADQLLTPAGEWLFDNFYLIEEQIRTAKRHLPKSYSRELPLLARGHLRRSAASL